MQEIPREDQVLGKWRSLRDHLYEIHQILSDIFYSLGNPHHVSGLHRLLEDYKHDRDQLMRPPTYLHAGQQT